MSKTWKPGDLVELNSGGPVMSVYKVVDDGPSFAKGDDIQRVVIPGVTEPAEPGDVVCRWFVGGTAHAATFCPEQLVVASSGRKGRRKSG